MTRTVSTQKQETVSVGRNSDKNRLPDSEYRRTVRKNITNAVMATGADVGKYRPTVENIENVRYFDIYPTF